MVILIFMVKWGKARKENQIVPNKMVYRIFIVYYAKWQNELEIAR